MHGRRVGHDIISVEVCYVGPVSITDIFLKFAKSSSSSDRRYEDRGGSREPRWDPRGPPPRRSVDEREERISRRDMSPRRHLESSPPLRRGRSISPGRNGILDDRKRLPDKVRSPRGERDLRPRSREKRRSPIEAANGDREGGDKNGRWLERDVDRLDD